MKTAMERYGVADLANRDPRDLLVAARLIEAERLAAEIRPLLNGVCRVDVCLSVDHETAYVGLWAANGERIPAPEWAGNWCLELQPSEAARLRDTLRNIPGRHGLERFYQS